MNTLVFNSFKEKLALQQYDLANDDFYIALMAPSLSAVANLEDYDTWYQLAGYEITATGYTQNGQLLTNITLTKDNSTNKVKWDASDPQWLSSSISAVGAIIYTGNDLVCYQDYGTIRVSENATFLHSFNVNGILNIN